MNYIDKVLDSIDMVDDVTLEYSFNIVDSMFKAYEKSAIILENYEGDDLSSFTIFQEGEIMDDVKRQGKGQGTLMKILTALPRLIIAVFRKLTGTLKKVGDPEELNKKMDKLADGSKQVMGVLLSKADKKQKRQKLKDAMRDAGIVLGGAALGGILIPKAVDKVNEKVLKPYNDKHWDEAAAKAAEIEEKLSDEFLLKYSAKMDDASSKYFDIVDKFNHTVDEFERWCIDEGFNYYRLTGTEEFKSQVEFIVHRTWSGASHVKSGKVTKSEVNPNIVDMPFRILHVLDPIEGTAHKMGDMIKSLDKDKKLDMFLNKNDGKTNIKNDNFEIVKSSLSAMIRECREAILAVCSEKVESRFKHQYILSSEELNSKYSTSKLDKKQKEIGEWYDKNLNDITDCGKNIEKLYTDDKIRELVNDRTNDYCWYIKSFLELLTKACEFYKSIFDMLNELIKDVADMNNKIREPFKKVKSIPNHHYGDVVNDYNNAGKSYAKNKNKE